MDVLSIYLTGIINNVPIFHNNMIRKYIKQIVCYLLYNKLKKKVTLLGTHYRVGLHAVVSFRDGSCKSDITIGNNVDVYGRLYTQSHGKIVIGNSCRIGLNVTIRSVELVSLGNSVILSEGVMVTDNNSHPTVPLFQYYRSQMPPSSTLHLWKHSAHKPVIIEDNVWIGEHARICKGVTIGKNSIIGANSVVTKDVPRNCIAAGNPAKIVRTDIDKLPWPNTCPEFDLLIEKYGRDIK